MAKIITYVVAGIFLAYILAVILFGGVSSPSYSEQNVDVKPIVEEPEVTEVEVKTIVSYKFPPGYNNPDMTELQKEAYFDIELKDNYVQWTGVVSDVTLSGKNTVKISVDHGNSMTSNALIRLNDDQVSKAITLKRGDTVTYTAKMTRWGSFLGFYGEDGVII